VDKINLQLTTYNLQRTTKIFSTPKLLNLSTPQPLFTICAYLCAFVDKINLQLTTYNEQQKIFPFCIKFSEKKK